MNFGNFGPQATRPKETIGKMGGFSIQIFPLSSPQGLLKKRFFFRPLISPKVPEKISGEKSGLKTPNFPHGFL